MRAPRRVFAVDDDPVILIILKHCLEAGGFDVTLFDSGSDALVQALAHPPDCLVLDVMMPGLDGLEICRLLRAEESMDATRIIVMSGKDYDSDRRRALSLGADAFIAKPIEPTRFANQVERILEDRIHLVAWGVRGTLPVPGPRGVRYGGNTSCVSLEFAREPLLVFDAGTGIKALSDYLRAQNRVRIDTKVLLSHPHWDHINALPFYYPLYVPGSAVEIMGPSQGVKGVEEYLKEQMDGVYFPVTAREFAAQVSFRTMHEESLSLGNVRIHTMLLHHPGHCLGYRVEYDGRVVCYITDNELDPQQSGVRGGYFQKLVNFVQGADVLITDSTYTDEEYATHRQWGHSPVVEVVNLAHQAEVKTLCLFHHDPDQDDDAIDRKLAQACRRLEQLASTTRCLAPVEGEVLSI